MMNAQELIAIISEKISRRTWVEWKPIFDAWDAPWELARTVPDVRDDPQVTANEMIYDITLPNGDDLMLVSSPVSVDGRNTVDEPHRAPDLGQHTDEVLRDIGYSSERIAALRDTQTIQ